LLPLILSEVGDTIGIGFFWTDTFPKKETKSSTSLVLLTENSKELEEEKYLQEMNMIIFIVRFR
jgi:hypothetical protein